MEQLTGTRLARTIFPGVLVVLSLATGAAWGAPETPPSIEPDDLTKAGLDTASSDVVGVVDGGFRVDEAGAATYSIPIKAPTGVAGVTPQISLNYSSSGGNGPVGKGWSIGGLSAITRCRQTLRRDGVAKPLNWGEQDRFCLNGQPLVRADGNLDYHHTNDRVYHTEIDSYAEIKAQGGTKGKPDYFTMESKDGSTTYFGGEDAPASELRARDDADNVTENVLSWSVSKQIDSANNKIEYIYANQAFGQYIEFIRYAYNADSYNADSYFADIKFVYGTRTDNTYGYVAGYRFKSQRRLNRIEVRNNEEKAGGAMAEYRTYKLDYGTLSAGQPFNQLRKIEECVGAICLEAAEFDWSAPPVGFSADSLSTELSDSSNKKKSGSHRLGDINGDGRQDIIWMEVNVDHDFDNIIAHRWRYSLYDPGLGAFTAPVLFLEDDSGHAEETPPYAWAVLDYNSDGFSDVLLPKDGEWLVVLAKTDGSGYSDITDYAVHSSPNDDPQDYVFNLIELGIPTVIGDDIQILDVNSDGLPDLVHEGFHPQGGKTDYIRLMTRTMDEDTDLWVNRFGGAQILHELLPAAPDVLFGLNTMRPSYYELITEGGMPVGDFDGDGNMDLLVRHYSWRVVRGHVDYMEMGLVALVARPDANSGTVAYENTGLKISTAGSAITDGRRIKVADINADGLSDVVVASSSDLDQALYTAYLNRGNASTGVNGFQPITIDAVWGGERLQLADYDRNGTLDLTYPAGNGSLNYRLFDANNESFQTELNTNALFVNSGDGDDWWEEWEYFYFTDVTGDLVPDFIAASAKKVRLYKGAGSLSNIHEIDTGLGNVTTITYAPTTDKYVYQRDSDANSAEWDLLFLSQTLGKTSTAIFDIYPASYVVKLVAGTSPTAIGSSPGNVNQTATSQILYAYKGAKLQAGGVGYLGFREVASLDGQSGMATMTSFRQDFPFIGRPAGSETVWVNVFTEEEVTVSSSATWWGFTNWNNGHTVAPYRIAAGTDWNLRFDPVSGASIGVVTNENTYDDLWGNIATTNTKTFNNTADFINAVSLSTVETANTYHEGMADNYGVKKGRLFESTVTYKRPDTDDIVRETEFYYFGLAAGNHKGLLKTEILNPHGAEQKLTTNHSYDPWGNRIKTTVVGDPDGAGSLTSPQSRSTRWVYDNRGRQVDKTYRQSGTTALSAPADPNGTAGEILVEEVTGRNQWGLPTVVKDTYGTPTTIRYGKLGREYHRYNGLGSWQTTLYYGFASQNCPAGTKVTVRTTTAEGQEMDTCLDAAGRTVRTSKLAFKDDTPGVQKAIHESFEYDSRGLLKWQSIPYFAGTNTSWSKSTYDRLGRVSLLNRADGVNVQTTYEGLKATTVLTGGQQKVEITNALGESILVTDAIGGVVGYVYDAAGNLVKTSTAEVLLAPTTDVEMEYDAYGRKTETDDPDKGTWTYKHNAFGEVVEQTDAKGQISKMTYDPMGRMRTRKAYAPAPGSALVEDAVWHYDDYGVIFPGLVKPGHLTLTSQISKTTGGVETANEGKIHTYDSKGRSNGYTTLLTVAGEPQRTFTEGMTYDEHGRIFQHFDTTGSGRGARYVYNNRGYLDIVKEAYIDSVIGQVVYSDTIAMDALGNVTQQTLGSRTIKRTYEQSSGRLTFVESYLAGNNATKDKLTLAYDPLGNLRSRKRESDISHLTQESFCYDALNRLTKSHTNTLTGGCTETDTTYAASGNITKKNGLTYTYPTGAGVARPHAVSSLKNGLGAVTASYTYDANGNMMGGDGRAFTYSVFDQMTKVTRGTSNTLEFTYGIDRQRNFRRETVSGSITKTYYMGSAERVELPSGDIEIRRRIGGEVVAIHPVDASGNILDTKRRYQMLDQLGSPVALYDNNAVPQQRLSFGGWGNRQNYATLAALSPYTSFVTETVRGYTGHEHGDVFGIIHMNGRIYDPQLGRMLQADPFIQAPSNTQSFNRYSYGFNNPLNGTDPSGYSFLGDVGDFFGKAIVGAAKVYVSVQVCGYYAAACYAGISAAEAKAQGASWADAALHGAVSGAAFYAGDQLNTAMNFSGGDEYGLNVSIVLPEFNVSGISSGGNANRTAAQIAKGTYAPWTGQKFISGVDSTTWRMASSNQREVAQQTTSTAGRDFIIGWEGFESNPYKVRDSSGKPTGRWTVGYGHEMTKEEYQSGQFDNISKTQAAKLLAVDLAKAEAKVHRFIAKNNPSISVSQNQFDALVSLTFNSGYVGQRPRLSANFAVGNHTGVAAEFLDITNGGVAGLVSRRIAESDLYLNGDYSGRP